MHFISNLSSRAKSILIMAPICLALSFFSVNELIENRSDMTAANNIQHLVELAAAGSSLVHEIQKERGASAGYLGSKGAKFKQELLQQHRDTDKRLKEWQEVYDATKSGINNDELLSLMGKASGKLGALSSKRSRILALNTPVKEAIGFYTGINNNFLGAILPISDSSTHVEINKTLSALYNFLSSKERAGIERAVMANVFSVGQFTELSTFSKFIRLTNTQDIYMDTYLRTAGDEQIQFYHQMMSHPSIDEVKKYRETALSKGIGKELNKDAVQWFKTATRRINQLKKVENELTEHLLNQVHELYTKASSTFYSVLILTIVVLTVVATLVTILINQAKNQFQSIINTMSLATENKDLTQRAQIITGDDLGRLAESLNEMLDSFSFAIDTIGTASVQLAASAEETNQTLISNKELLEGQLSQSELVATASEEMSSTTHEVANNTTLTAETAARANASATDGAQLVKHNTISVRDLASEVQSIGKIIEELHEGSADITNVIEVIKSVAEQTNLLSLNAAIEAARAGEQGRGFAVVADEVRTLAQRTADSTREIETIISSFRNKAEQAFEAITTGKDKAEGVATETAHVETVFSDIIAEIDSINGMMVQVASAAEQQSATTNEIAKSITAINSGMVAASESAEQIQSASLEQAGLAANLQDLATAFRIKS